MASSVGGLIEAVDYNSIRNKVIAVLGTGSSSTGYGQDSKIQSSAVVALNTVTALQWQNLRWDIYNCLVHQNGVSAVPTIVNVSAGQPVRFGAAHPNNAFDTFANTLTSSRFNLGSGRFSTVNLGSTSWSDTWAGSAYVDITYTFATANDARFFFNSGGQLRVQTTRSTGGTAQGISWYNLLVAAGRQSFGAQTPTSGFSPLNGQNYYRLTSSFQTYYTATASSPYSSNSYQLQARCNVADNSTGSANIIFIRALLTDAYRDPDDLVPSGPGQRTAPDDIVDGTFTVDTDMILPGGPIYPTGGGLGNFTVRGPNGAGGGSTSFGAVIRT